MNTWTKYDIHTMDYYLALKRKEILTHTTTFMIPWRHYINEINQSHTNTIYIVQFILYEISRVVTFIETETGMVVARAGEVGE